MSTQDLVIRAPAASVTYVEGGPVRPADVPRRRATTVVEEDDVAPGPPPP